MPLNNSIKNEILDLAHGQNVIACLGPGKDSFWVTLDLIKKHLKNPKKIVYVGDDLSALNFYNYVHNMTDIKITVCKNPSDIRDNKVLSVNYKSMNELMMGKLKWPDISLLIIEDLQHIHTNNSLFNILFCHRHYLLEKPAVFAICSMSFAFATTPASVQNLFNIFKNELSYKFVVGLRMCENIQEILVEFENQEKGEISDKIELEIKSVEKFVSMCQYSSYELGLSVMPNFKERINLILGSLTDLIYSMGLWCTEKSLIYYFEIIEKMKLCTVENEKQYLLLNLVRTLIIKICNLCHEKRCTTDLSSILNYSSPKILRTREILRVFKSSINEMNFKMIILVQNDMQINLLHNLFKELNKCDIDFKYIEPQIYDSKCKPSNLILMKISSIKNAVLPKFNLIIEYDEINDFEIYISSKCKLDNNGVYVKLVEKAKSKELFLQHSNFSSAEKLFLEYDFKPEENGITDKAKQDLDQIFSYCLKLPSDSYTILEPCLKIKKETGKFTAKISFPPNSPFRNDIISQPMEKKEDSIKMACMKASSLLCEDETETKFQKSNKKPENMTKTASCFKNCRPEAGKPMLYILNIQNRSNLGILTTKNIPEISPLNLGTEKNPMFIHFIPQNVKLDENHIRRIENFMILLAQVCEDYQYFYPYNTKNSFMIVPVKKNDIDWDLLESNDQNLLNIISDEKYKDVVFSPIYSPNQVFYIKDNICTDITLETKPKGTQYSSIKNYFEQKFNVEIKREQPLIYVKKIHGLKLKNGKYNEILVPELCSVHAIPGSIMRLAVFLPMALYNLNARLLSYEINLMVSRDVFLGNLDSDYQICNIPNSQLIPNVNNDFETTATLSRYEDDVNDYYCSNSESDDEYSDANHDFPTHTISADFVKKGIETILNVEQSIQDLIRIQHKQDIIPEKLIKVCSYTKNKENPIEELISDQIIYIRSNQLFKITYTEKNPIDKKYVNKIQNFTSDINEVFKWEQKKYAEALILEDFKKISLTNPPGPDMQHINDAMTLNKPNPLQIVGFSFLNCAVAMYLFSTDQSHIGKLEDRLTNVISDTNLYNLAQEKGLRSRMMTVFDEFFWARQETYSNVADCVKKLIGTYVEECGQRGGFILISWIGIDVLPKYIKPTLHGSNQRSVGSYPPSGNTQTILGILEPPEGPKLSNHLTEIDILDINETVDKIEDILQYSFNKKTFLLQSMTHASCNILNDCSQRLSFLGEKILNYVITQYLYDKFKNKATLEYLVSVIIKDEFYAFLVVKIGLHKYYKKSSHQLDKAINEHVMEVEKNKFQLDEEFYHSDGGNEEDEIVKIISSIFKSVAAAVFCDSDYSFSALWTVIYKIIKTELDECIKQMEHSPVKQLCELYPGKTKFRNDPLKFGLKSVDVEISDKGVFKGLGMNYRQAKLRAANLALSKLKNA